MRRLRFEVHCPSGFGLMIGAMQENTFRCRTLCSELTVEEVHIQPFMNKSIIFKFHLAGRNTGNIPLEL